jgi:hypothetical protein
MGFFAWLYNLSGGIKRTHPLRPQERKTQQVFRATANLGELPLYRAIRFDFPRPDR